MYKAPFLQVCGDEEPDEVNSFFATDVIIPLKKLANLFNSLQSDIDYFKSYSLTPPSPSLCSHIQMNTTGYGTERMNFLEKICAWCDLYCRYVVLYQSFYMVVFSNLISPSPYSKNNYFTLVAIETNLRLIKSRFTHHTGIILNQAKKITSPSATGEAVFKEPMLTYPTVFREDGTKVGKETLKKIFDAGKEIMKKGEDDDVLGMVEVFVSTVVDAFEVVFNSGGGSNANADVGLTLGLAYGNSLFIRLASQVYNLDLAVDQMLEGHIFDITQSTVSEGTFFVSDMDKIVDESNKVLDGEGKKIATHKDDLFLK